jgi:hypothetical protein
MPNGSLCQGIGRCLDGVCTPQTPQPVCASMPDHTPCGGVCQEYIGGGCVNKPSDSVCNGDGRCLVGICNPLPQCVGFNTGGCATLGADICCSGVCDATVPTGVCQKGAAGTPCRVNRDCTSGLCLGYRCV